MFSENTIKIVFSEKKTQLFKNTAFQKHFFHPRQKHLFQKKCHLWFWAISAETTIFYSASWFTLFWAKKFLAKTDSVHENAFFSLPDTNSVRQFWKIQFFDFSHFWMTTLKSPIFVGLFGLSIFFFFCFYLSNIKKEKLKMQFSFENLIFYIPPKKHTHTILAQCDTIYVFKNTPKHYKNGENSAKKNLDQFLTLDLDQLLTLETPNLGTIFNSTADICMYIYI